MKWKPIETAPKDKPILVIGGEVSPDVGGDYPLTIPMVVDWQGYWSLVHSCYYSVDTYNPTHWCELPELQEETKDDNS